MHLHDELHPVVVREQFLSDEVIVGKTPRLVALVLCQFLGHHNIQSTTGIGTAQRFIFQSQQSSSSIVFLVRQQHFEGHDGNDASTDVCLHWIVPDNTGRISGYVQMEVSFFSRFTPSAFGLHCGMTMPF